MTGSEQPELANWDERSESSSVALFAGDAGGLSFEQRRCLVRLLKERYISRDAQPELWDVLTRNEETMRSRLNDLFLTLHVDREGEVAYKRQAIPDDSTRRFPTLLHDTAYNREETILLVYLRERLQRERAAGAETVLVDLEDLLERVVQFRPADATDLAADSRRANNAVEALRKSGVLHASGEADRFTVSPVLDSLMPLPRLQQLLDWLRSEAGKNPQDTGDDGQEPDRTGGDPL